MKLAATVCAVVVAAQLALAAPSPVNANNEINLLSKKSTDDILRAHLARRQQSNNKGGNLRKRGLCPAKGSVKPSSAAAVAPSSASSASSAVEQPSSAAPTKTVKAAYAKPSSSSVKQAGPEPEPQTSTKEAYVPPSTSEQPAPAPSSTSTSSSKAPEPTKDLSPISDANTQLGWISGFQGKNSGIGSWFRTHAGSDSTNGRSWCQTQYKDDWMCFAPSVGTMLGNFGWDYSKATKAYCGREVKLYNPNNGKSATGFICDGFDDKWVRTPGSIDLTIGLFTALHGSFDNNKNTVIQNLEWEFTGGVVSKGTFKSSESQW